MEITIGHKKTKRKINGPFTFCCGKNELMQLKEIIDSELENGFSYGWINVDEFIIQKKGEDFDLIKKQRPLVNKEPISWD